MRILARIHPGRLALLLLVMAILGTLVAGRRAAAAAPVSARANGDIPDSATYLRYTAAHASIEYIEGWGRRNSGQTVTFSDKDSMERLTLVPAPRGPLEAFVRGHELAALRHAGATHLGTPRSLTLPGGHAWYLQFVMPSTPDQVTGKVVSLLTDLYYIQGARYVAELTMAAPVGDDNVDAFRRISRSFAWR